MSSNLKAMDELFHEWEVGYLSLAIQMFKAHGSTARTLLREEWDIRLTDPQVTALVQFASVL
jgi:hypothetical protein